MRLKIQGSNANVESDNIYFYLRPLVEYASFVGAAARQVNSRN